MGSGILIAPIGVALFGIAFFAIASPNEPARIRPLNLADFYGRQFVAGQPFAPPQRTNRPQKHYAHVFDGLRNMLPEPIVEALDNLKAEDLAAARRVFQDLSKAQNLKSALQKESMPLFHFVQTTIHTLRDQKKEAFGKFLPKTNDFITKLQDILYNAIEETHTLYKLQPMEVKDNLRSIFPRSMFIVEHPTFKHDLITLCCCCHHHHGGGGGGDFVHGFLGGLFG